MLALSVAAATVVGAALAVALAGLLMRCLVRVRRTTLNAPCLWTLTAVALITASALTGKLAGSSNSVILIEVLRFAAAATTFCPLMAVLGAKRPQHLGWQWVVVTMWIVLVWPAAQAALRPAGMRIELFFAWKAFLVGLIALGLLNYIPTKFWLSAVLVSVGQTLLFADFLWVDNPIPAEWQWIAALACFCAATLIATAQREGAANTHNSVDHNLAAFDRQWRDFRDAYGAFWALRILDRINHTSELRDWSVRLTWTGFAAVEQEKDPHPNSTQLAEIQQTMATLLRRFL